MNLAADLWCIRCHVHYDIGCTEGQLLNLSKHCSFFPTTAYKARLMNNTNHFLGRVGISSQNPSILPFQFKNLFTIVFCHVGHIVCLLDPILGLAVGSDVSATVDRARFKINTQLSWCIRQSSTSTDLIK